MRLWCAGWNGFGQWPGLDHQLNAFTQIEPVMHIPNIDENDFSIQMEWSYNVLVASSKMFIKGFHDAAFDQTFELTSPAIFNKCACNDKHILFYNTMEKYVWKYYLDSDIEERWKRLPNFLEVERDVDANDLTCLNDETILKIVCSIRLNVALTSNGRLFHIPYEISTNNIGKVIDVECGHEHAILLTEEGNVYTWGGGSRCQLGHGNTECYQEPELVEALSGIKIAKISAGGWHSCAISSFGDLYTWGWNERGQLGVFVHPDDTKYVHPIKSDSKSNAISKDIDTQEQSPNKKMLLSPENMHSDENKALPNYALPVLIDIYDSAQNKLDINVMDVSCGSKHTVIKLDDGSLWGAGCNKHGQLGFGGIEMLDSFTKLDAEVSNAIVCCGIWATILMSVEN